ncbi:MAG TPA: RIP metalloprotease RseP [Gammaproteobacteria bacterium]|nr:RIP metalloprotease RseP [Gammaproteobacteria bacterium]
MNNFLYSTGGFIVALGILVTIHEFGHFWVARRLGIKVLKFSIGFGRAIWSRKSGPDQIEYAVGILPLGGYVKMLDSTEGEVTALESGRAFDHQPVWKRSLVVLAGPGANFLFAIAAYWLVFAMGTQGLRPVVGSVVPGSPAAIAGFQKGDEIVAINGHTNRSWSDQRLWLFDGILDEQPVFFTVRSPGRAERQLSIRPQHMAATLADGSVMSRGLGLLPYSPPVPAVVDKVLPDSPAARAGLLPGDRILKINTVAITDWFNVQQIIAKNPGRLMRLEIERRGQTVLIPLTPGRVDVSGRAIGRIGIQRKSTHIPPDMVVDLRLPVFQALHKSIETTWLMSSLTLRMMGLMIMRKVSPKTLSGPLTIAQYAGQTAQIGLQQFLLFLAVVSVSLGVLNLLPVPVLDGGHLLYYIAEVISGRPLPTQLIFWSQQVGIVLLLGLMSVAFYNDIMRLVQ